jgi:hypothetical protein
MTAMELLLIAGMIVCGWVFLCVLSNERERRSNESGVSLHAGQGEKLTRSQSATKV